MTQLIKRFLTETRAAIAFEAVIVTPIMAWMFVGSFIFFDAYRTYNSSIKAAYAVADAISRQEQTLYQSDIDGFARIYEHLVRNSSPVQFRVSQVRMRNNGQLRVEWSSPYGGVARLFTSGISSYEGRIPVMSGGQRVILVEAWLPYEPFFGVGLGDLTFTNFSVTPPRFSGQIIFDDGTEPEFCGFDCNAFEGEVNGGFDDDDDDDGA